MVAVNRFTFLLDFERNWVYLNKNATDIRYTTNILILNDELYANHNPSVCRSIHINNMQGFGSFFKVL